MICDVFLTFAECGDQSGSQTEQLVKGVDEEGVDFTGLTGDSVHLV